MTSMDHDDKVKPGEVHGTVEFLMRRMRHKGDLPAFSEHITEINSKLSSLTAISYSSVGDLAKIILKDFSLTNKLLRVVNSALYGTLSGKVTTISKAVFLLGFDKVRMISAALMVYDHLQNKTQAAELKEMAVASFMSGVMAMRVVETIRRGEREEAFICAMLHNLGKMLVVCYLPEEYEEIKSHLAREGADEGRASKAVLGVSYSELGMAVSRSWNFPDKIVRSMEYPPAGVLSAPKTEQEILRNISSYSNEMLDAVLEARDEDRGEVLSDLSKRYHNSISLPVEQMETLIDETVKRVNDFTGVVRADRTMETLKKKLVRARQGQTPESPEAAGAEQPHGRSVAAGSGPAASGRPGPSGEQQVAILASGIHEIHEVMKSGRNLSDVIYMIIETMYRGCDFTRVIFCLRDATKTKMMGRFGLGEQADELVRHFEFRIGKSADIFNIAISQAKGIVIDDATAPTILKNLPEWYRSRISAPSFLIYPLVFKGGCIGLFYADRKEKGAMLTDVQRSRMEELRGMAVDAIAQKHR
jgi:HD-like signal output (HDOD) protein/GAF domain-containing protein